MTFLEIAQNVPEHIHLIWNNVFFYFFIGAFLLFGGVLLAVMKLVKTKITETRLMQQQHVAKVDIIRKEHTEKLDGIRVEMLKREEERSRQWMESEKETLHVLNGVSTLLDLSEKIGRVESEKILSKLEEIQAKVENITIIEEKLKS